MKFIVDGSTVVMKIKVGRAFCTVKESWAVTIVTIIVTNDFCVIESVSRVHVKTFISLIAHCWDVITKRTSSITSS